MKCWKTIIGCCLLMAAGAICAKEALVPGFDVPDGVRLEKSPNVAYYNFFWTENSALADLVLYAVADSGAEELEKRVTVADHRFYERMGSRPAERLTASDSSEVKFGIFSGVRLSRTIEGPGSHLYKNVEYVLDDGVHVWSALLLRAEPGNIKIAEAVLSSAQLKPPEVVEAGSLKINPDKNVEKKGNGYRFLVPEGMQFASTEGRDIVMRWVPFPRPGTLMLMARGTYTSEADLEKEAREAGAFVKSQSQEQDDAGTEWVEARKSVELGCFRGIMTDYKRKGVSGDAVLRIYCLHDGSRIWAVVLAAEGTEDAAMAEAVLKSSVKLSS